MVINNIFTSLVRERSSGVIQEFVLWILTCVVIVMSMVAAIIGGGNLAWIFLMLFAIGLALLLAFRLKAIAMIYSVCCFYFLMSIIHFFKFIITSSVRDIWGVSNSILNIILFIFIMLISIALITLQFIQGFTKMDFEMIISVLAIVNTAVIMLLEILAFALPTLSEDSSSFVSAWRSDLNSSGYWIGTICYWTILIIVALIYIFSVWGPMDSNHGKVLSASAGSSRIRCVAGSYQGQVFSFRNGLFVIGSGDGVSLPLYDQYVSGRHCSIRFNSSTGFYEVLDESMNGTFLDNGLPLKKGVYNALQRGSVICIGSYAQKFMLL